jgi:hypothetical protein
VSGLRRVHGSVVPGWVGGGEGWSVDGSGWMGIIRSTLRDTLATCGLEEQSKTGRTEFSRIIDQFDWSCVFFLNDVSQFFKNI